MCNRVGDYLEQVISNTSIQINRPFSKIVKYDTTLHSIISFEREKEVVLSYFRREVLNTLNVLYRFRHLNKVY